MIVDSVRSMLCTFSLSEAPRPAGTPEAAAVVEQITYVRCSAR